MAGTAKAKGKKSQAIFHPSLGRYISNYPLNSPAATHSAFKCPTLSLSPEATLSSETNETMTEGQFSLKQQQTSSSHNTLLSSSSNNNNNNNSDNPHTRRQSNAVPSAFSIEVEAADGGGYINNGLKPGGGASSSSARRRISNSNGASSNSSHRRRSSSNNIDAGSRHQPHPNIPSIIDQSHSTTDTRRGNDKRLKKCRKGGGGGDACIHS